MENSAPTAQSASLLHKPSHPSPPAASGDEIAEPEDHERWVIMLHELGYHEKIVPASAIILNVPSPPHSEALERLTSNGGATVVAPNPGTITIKFTPSMVDCPVLKNYELSIPVLIGIDNSGAVTAAASRAGQWKVPGIVYRCVFQSYRDAYGNVLPAVVNYFPRAKPKGESSP